MIDGTALRNSWPTISAFSQLTIAVALVCIIGMSLWMRSTTLSHLEIEFQQIRTQQSEISATIKAADVALSERIADLELTVYGTLEPKLRKTIKPEPWSQNFTKDMRSRIEALERWRLAQGQK